MSDDEPSLTVTSKLWPDALAPGAYATLSLELKGMASRAPDTLMYVISTAGLELDPSELTPARLMPAEREIGILGDRMYLLAQPIHTPKEGVGDRVTSRTHRLRAPEGLYLRGHGYVPQVKPDLDLRVLLFAGERGPLLWNSSYGLRYSAAQGLYLPKLDRPA